MHQGDATGILLGRVAVRVAQRNDDGLPTEEVVVVSITDDHEDASREPRAANSEQRTANSEQRTANSEQRTANSEYTLAAVSQLIAAHTAAGWTTVNWHPANDVDVATAIRRMRTAS